MTPIVPYNNQPITAISSLKAGATQPYLQRAQAVENGGGDFLKILYDALKNPETTTKVANQQFNTILSKEVQNLIQQGTNDKDVAVADSNTQATKNFFSTIGETYYSLVSNNDAALGANFTSLFTDKKDTNSLFSTASDMRRAMRSYEKTSMLTPTNAGNSFFA